MIFVKSFALNQHSTVYKVFQINMGIKWRLKESLWFSIVKIFNEGRPHFGKLKTCTRKWWWVLNAHVYWDEILYNMTRKPDLVVTDS